jgi:hypothetical protein
VVGTLLYYARAVDTTLLTALSLIATEQVKPTQETMKKVKQLLDYCATQEDATITYNASQIILAIHSDAGYCNEKNARSQAGGHFFLSNNKKIPPIQRCNPDKRDHHQSSNVLSSRSLTTGSIISKCRGGSIPPTNTIQNGTSAAKDANPNRQHGSRGSDKQ